MVRALAVVVGVSLLASACGPGTDRVAAPAVGPGPGVVARAESGPPVLVQPTATPDGGDPMLSTGDSAITELRIALRVRSFPDAVVDSGMTAIRYDARHTIEGDDAWDAWPRGAWLVSTDAGRWWVWLPGTATPADDEARRWDDEAAQVRGWLP